MLSWEKKILLSSSIPLFKASYIVEGVRSLEYERKKKISSSSQGTASTEFVRCYHRGRIFTPATGVFFLLRPIIKTVRSVISGLGPPPLSGSFRSSVFWMCSTDRWTILVAIQASDECLEQQMIKTFLIDLPLYSIGSKLREAVNFEK